MGLWFNWFAGKLGEDAKLWWIVWSHYLKYHWFKYSNFYKFFSENSDWFCFLTPMSPLSSGAPWGSGLTCTNNWCIRGLKVDKKLYRMIQLFQKKKRKPRVLTNILQAHADLQRHLYSGFCMHVSIVNSSGVYAPRLNYIVILLASEPS